MDALMDRLKVVIIEGLHLEELTPSEIDADAPLFGDEGLGLDSVDALELVMEVERNFGVQIKDDEKSREILRSVRSLAGWIQAQG